MKISSLHDDLLWPCVAHACGLGEFDGTGKRAPIADRSPLIRAAQFGVSKPCDTAPRGEAAYEGYCATVGPTVGRHYETVVAAVFDRYTIADTHNPAAPPTDADRERAVLEDLSRSRSLTDCGLRIAFTANDIIIGGASHSANLVLAVEGMDFVLSEAQMETLWEAGVRIFALQYNRPNALTTGDCSENRGDTGLTPLGRRIVARLFAVGAILDLAHAAPGTRADILDFAEANGYGHQVAYTHGATLEDADPERAARLPGRFLHMDEVQRILCLGGIVGLTPAHPFFLSLERFAERMSHLYRETEGGAKGLALGTDFGGVWDGMLFPELRSVADMARLGNVLAERHGLTDAEIAAVLRTNVTAWLRRALSLPFEHPGMQPI
jgi:microsomal dipeptidase-like Zn-dependent dipeptidase